MKRKIKLTRQEQAIDNALLRDEFKPVPPDKFREIAEALQARKKDAVLNIRVNSDDLRQIKQKAKRLGIKYQTFISEILHQVAHQ